MTKITKSIANIILVAGWNWALNNVHAWIQCQRNEEPLTKKQNILLLELEQELNRMKNLWKGRQADD